MRRDIKLYIGGNLADISDESFILLNFTAEDADNPTAVMNSYSQSVTLPATDRNRQVFDGMEVADRITVAGGYNPLSRVPFTIEVDGEVYESGYCRLDSVTVGESYAVTLYGGLGGFLYALSYDDEGNEKTLADLAYLGAPRGDELDFTITAGNVQAAWARLVSVPASVAQKWDVINFAPSYNGTPGGSFKADKALVKVGEAGVSAQSGYAGKDGYALVNLTHGFNEWEMRDLRSYLQRPVFSLKAFMNALTNPDNTGGWAVDVSAVMSLPEIREGWMSLPMLTNIEKGASGTLANSKTESSYSYKASTRISVTGSAPAGSKVRCSAFVTPRLTIAGPTANVSLQGIYHNASLGDFQESTYLFFQMVAYSSSDTVVGASKTLVVHAPNNWDTAEVAAVGGYIPAGGVTDFVEVVDGTLTYKGSSIFDGKGAALTCEAVGAAYFVIEMQPLNFRARSNGQPTLEASGEYARIAYDLTTPTTSYNWSSQYAHLENNASVTYESTTTVRSGALLTKADLLGGTPSPAKMLTSIVRALGLKVLTDDVARTVTILPRSGYYTGVAHDIDKAIDRSKPPIISPSFATSKWLDFEPEGIGAAFPEAYKAKYGREYGSQRVNTNYPFDEAHKAALDGIAFKRSATALAKSPYFYTVDDNGTNKPAALLDEGNTYSLWNSATGESKDFELPTPASGTTLTPRRSESGYDYWWRVQFHDGSGKPIDDGSGVLMYFTGSKALAVQITDDTTAMQSILGTEACWLPYYGSAAITVPSFATCVWQDASGGTVETGADFGVPRELAWPVSVNTPYPEAATLYARYYKAYIEDRYDVDAKVIRCSVHWGRLEVSAERLRDFYLFDNCVYVLNKIINHSLTTDGPTECEFIRVKDTTAYTSGYTPGPGPSPEEPYLSVSPASLTFEAAGGTLNIGVSSNVAWSVSGAPAWLTLRPSSGSGSANIEAEATANGTPDERTATLTFSATGVASVTVTISQPAATAPYLNLDTNSLSFGDGSGATTLEVYSNVAWEVSNIPDIPGWVHLSATQGNGRATLVVSVDANHGSVGRVATERPATITFSDTSGSGVPDVTLAITQAAPVVNSLTPSSASISGDGGNFALQINAIGDWSLNPDSGVSLNQLTGNGNATVTVTVAPNTGSHRTLHVYISLDDNPDAVCPTLTISQAAAALKVLKFTASDGAVQLSFAGTFSNLEWSEDNGQSWTNWDGTAKQISDGNSLQVRGYNNTFSGQFTMTGSGTLACEGSVMGLVDYGNGFTAIPANVTFANLFDGCDLLTSAPDLPATTLRAGCYKQMFLSCTNLVTPPALLPALTLQPNCYEEMFYECSAMTSAPNLPATTLAESCYKGMFGECNSLLIAPNLPAETLVAHCYESMFDYAVALESVVCMAHDVSATDCTKNWLRNVAANGTFVYAAGYQSIWSSGASGIPVGWIAIDDQNI